MIYEKTKFPRRVHYAVFWIVASGIIFGLQEVAMLIERESGYSLARLILAANLCGQPIGLVFMKNYFHRTLSNLQGIVQLSSGQNFEEWVSSETARVFSLKVPYAMAFPVLLIAVANLTLLIASIPYQSPRLNALWFIMWQPVLFVSGHTAYIIGTTIRLLPRLSELTFDVPFYRMKHPGIVSLWEYYSRASLLIVGFYISVVLMFLYSPFKSILQMAGWLGFASFFPLGMIVSTLAYMHKILRRVKQEHMDTISQRIQEALELQRQSPSKDNVEILSGLMDVQEKIEECSEWPFGLESGVTLFITMVLPIVQIASSMYEWFKDP